MGIKWRDINQGSEPSMRQVVYGDDARYTEWAAKRIGVQFPPNSVAIGLCRADDIGAPGGDRDSVGRLIIASVVFEGFSECDCNMHVASDGTGRWLTREFLVRCFAYPFIQCGLRRVTGKVPAKNTAALKFDQGLGFRIEGRCAEAMPDDDIIILGLLKRNCRFIPQEQHHG